MPRIYIWNDALPSTSLKNVVVFGKLHAFFSEYYSKFPITQELGII